MMVRPTGLLLLFVLLAGGLLVPLDVRAQDTSSAGESFLTFDEALRLTWRTETRAQGVAALRRLLAGDPESTQIRFELGRVLTWNVSTRPEGLRLLRRVTQDAPDWTEADETLGEVLAWDDASREEAIVRLRRVVEREPTRVSARLKLADVLSWNPVTRDESESIYRGILQEDQTSVPATVGLARVLSWRGRFDESRVLYRQVLLQDPGVPAAWVGLAELENWSGRAHASLATLAAFPEGTVETPEAHRLRAQAYGQIGRPARALEEYEALLALEPGNLSAIEAMRILRRRLRPLIEIGAEGSDESGDAATDKVRVSAVPLRFSFHPGGGDTTVSLWASVGSYRNSGGESRDAMVGGGIDSPLGNKARLLVEVTGHEFTLGRRELSGRVELRGTPHDRVGFSVGVARSPLSSSRLSLGGEQFGGVQYGPAFAEEAFVGATLQLGRGWDAWGHLARGWVRGVNLARNDREELFAGFGRTFRPRSLTLRPGYTLAWIAHDRDLGGFPATDLAGDGVVRRGVGGYFSPLRFLNQTLRFDVTIPVSATVFVVGGGGVGLQQVEDTMSLDFSSRSTSSNGYLGARVALGARVSFRAQLNYQDVASAFDRTVAQLTFAYAF